MAPDHTYTYYSIRIVCGRGRAAFFGNCPDCSCDTYLSACSHRSVHTDGCIYSNGCVDPNFRVYTYGSGNPDGSVHTNCGVDPHCSCDSNRPL